MSKKYLPKWERRALSLCVVCSGRAKTSMWMTD